jgi:uncharacterized protein (TIGR01244 family)
LSDFRTLSDSVFASPQISTADLAAARELGVTMVVNNRPDGEAPDQTPGADIAQAAEQAGLAYRAIPVDHSGYSPSQVEAMSEALDAAGGKLLAYCRTGTRSTFLWALSSASRGEDPRAIVEAASAAGYDLSPIRPALEHLAARATD